MAAPYEHTYAAGGERYFDAPLPAWSKIGARFDELSEAYYDFEYPPEHFRKGRELVQALREQLRTVESDPQAWAGIDRQLHARFGERFLEAKQRLPAALDEYFTTGQMPAAEYLRWIAVEAETRLAGEGDPEADWNAIETERAALAARLTSGGYTSERDRQMQAEDPARHAFLEKSLGALSQQMQNPTEGNALEEMLVEQMKLFQQSPLFAQAQEQMSEMMQGLESIKDSDPELYEQQREQLAAATELFRDPAAAMKNIMANLADDPDEIDDQAEPELPALPAGTLRFACGQKKITPAQRKLFEQLQKDQHRLLPQIEQALRALHDQMDEGQTDDPREAVLFPPNAEQSDVPLSAFSIERVELDRDGRYAILWLDTLFPHFDEHGCGIRIENGVVTRYGTWDDVCEDEFEEEECEDE